MKHYILLHNIVTMVQASVQNSVEGFTDDEKEHIRLHLWNDVTCANLCGHITDKQMDMLHALIENI